MPLQFIFFYFSIKQMLFLPFVAVGYYKIWKIETNVISLKDCKLKCFSSKCFCFSFSFYLFSEVLIIPQ